MRLEIHSKSCKDRSLQVSTVYDDEVDRPAASNDEDKVLEEEEYSHLDAIEESLNSVAGFASNRTMKIKGVIGEQEEMALIDSVATHNFIANWVVWELDLRLADTGSFGVTLGTGKVEMSTGVCRRLILEVQGIRVRMIFFLWISAEHI